MEWSTTPNESEATWLWMKSSVAIGRLVTTLDGRLPVLAPEGLAKNVMTTKAGNGPSPIPDGMKTPEVRVSDLSCLLTTTVSTPLSVVPAAAGIYEAVMVQSEQSGFGPISYFSIAALISLRRRSQLANEVSRVPSTNR